MAYSVTCYSVPLSKVIMCSMNSVLTTVHCSTVLCCVFVIQLLLVIMVLGTGRGMLARRNIMVSVLQLVSYTHVMKFNVKMKQVLV